MTPEELVSRTVARLPHLAGASLTPIEKGGSARSFHRVSAPGGSAVLVRDFGEREENGHYAALAGFLGAQGVPVPAVLAKEGSLLWLEDLGESDLCSFRNEPWEIRRPLYESTLRGAATLHAIPDTTAAASGIRFQAPFDEALYRWEQGYFAEHCLGGVFGLPETRWKSLPESDPMRGMARRLASLPRSFVHRDFQSQNIIIREGEARFIDFQGMRHGLPQYDLASLLCDPYVTLSLEEREHLLGYHHALGACGARGPGEDREESDRIFWQCAAQRLMQALGAYGFLSIHRGKKAFRAHVAPALTNLREALSRLHSDDRLDEVSALIEDLEDAPPAPTSHLP